MPGRVFVIDDSRTLPQRHRIHTTTKNTISARRLDMHDKREFTFHVQFHQTLPLVGVKDSMKIADALLLQDSRSRLGGSLENLVDQRAQSHGMFAFNAPSSGFNESEHSSPMKVSETSPERCQIRGSQFKALRGPGWSLLMLCQQFLKLTMNNFAVHRRNIDIQGELFSAAELCR